MNRKEAIMDGRNTLEVVVVRKGKQAMKAEQERIEPEAAHMIIEEEMLPLMKMTDGIRIWEIGTEATLQEEAICIADSVNDEDTTRRTAGSGENRVTGNQAPEIL